MSERDEYDEPECIVCGCLLSGCTCTKSEPTTEVLERARRERLTRAELRVVLESAWGPYCAAAAREELERERRTGR